MWRSARRGIADGIGRPGAASCKSREGLGKRRVSHTGVTLIRGPRMVRQLPDAEVTPVSIRKRLRDHSTESSFLPLLYYLALPLVIV